MSETYIFRPQLMRREVCSCSFALPLPIASNVTSNVVYSAYTNCSPLHYALIEKSSRLDAQFSLSPAHTICGVLVCGGGGQIEN